MRRYHDFARTTRKVCCIGRNYTAHIAELNNQTPSTPFFFLKPPSSIVQPPSPSGTSLTPPLTGNEPSSQLDPSNRAFLQLPKGVESHHEVELGVVIGKELRELVRGKRRMPTGKDREDGERWKAYLEDPGVREAYGAVAGYFTGIDMTGRNLQERVKKAGLPWTTPKGFDSYLPASHYVPKEKELREEVVVAGGRKVRNVGEAVQYGLVEVFLSLSGEGVRQRDRTDLMVYDLPRILSHISSIMTLYPGDVVLTGTPKGVSRCKDGQVMAAEMRVVKWDREDTSPGEVITNSRVVVDCVDRKGGFNFTAE
ncbi:hypothetical protein PYCC9005_004664 [Savitreella phatthalungensis]